MSAGYYVSGPERSRRVRELFARIAPRYDLINDVQSMGLHRLWKRQMAKAAQASAGMTVLDVCCGTGDIARELQQHGALVTGCDFSREMLEAGRTGRESDPLLVQGDALRLPFQDSTFHVVTIGYGLRNLADFEEGLRELLRVLRPGGRLLILDFGKPRNTILRAAYFCYLRMVVPVFGRCFAGDAAAYAYILESLERYPAQDGVTQLLRSLGCPNVQVRNFLGGVMSLHCATRAASLRQRDNVALEPGDFVAKR